MLPKKDDAPLESVWHVWLLVLAAPMWSGEVPVGELGVEQQCPGQVDVLSGGFRVSEGPLEAGCTAVSTVVFVPQGAASVTLSFEAQRTVSGTLVGQRDMVQDVQIGDQTFPIFSPDAASGSTTFVQQVPADGPVRVVWWVGDAGIGESLSVRVSGIQAHVYDVPLAASQVDAGRYLEGGRLVRVQSLEVEAPPAAQSLRFGVEGRVESLRGPDGALVPLSQLAIEDGSLTVPPSVLAAHGPGTYALQTSSAAPLPGIGVHPALLTLLAAPGILAVVSVRGAVRQWRQPGERRHEVHRLVAQNAVVAAGYVVVLAMAWWAREAVAEAPFGRMSLLVMGQALVVFLAFLALWQLGARSLARRLRADLRRREEEERHLRELNLKLQHSNEDLERFAHVASHDLKEPLRSIQVHSERVLAKYAEALDEAGRRSLELAAGGARRMRDLVDGLLGYSHMGQAGAEPERIDMQGAACEVVQGLEPLIQERGATVRVEDVPDVAGHRQLVQQAIQNLLVNALKHGGKHIVVRGHGTCIEVADDGPGIPDEHQQRIFEPFQRLQGRTEEAGTGLGLAIVRRTMELHHGTAGVRSSPGGTVFYLEFPGGT